MAIKYFIFKYHLTITDKRFCWLLARINAGYVPREGHHDHDCGLAAPMKKNPDILVV